LLLNENFEFLFSTHFDVYRQSTISTQTETVLVLSLHNIVALHLYKFEQFFPVATTAAVSFIRTTGRVILILRPVKKKSQTKAKKRRKNFFHQVESQERKK
jgi:hypothetical protein